MKRILAIFLAIVMILSLTACGEEKTGTGEIKTALFSLSFDKSVWTNIEDDLSDGEEYCFANLQVLNPDDAETYLVDAEIEVSVDEPYDFREDLVHYGFDQYEYKVNNAYETVNIGGVDLIKYDDGEEEIVYMNRVEGAGATVSIKFDTVDIADTRIAELLKGITFTLTDTGNADGPWEWEGTKFTTEDHSVDAGGFTVTSKFVPFEQYVSTFETFDHGIAAVGNTVYLLIDGELNECHYDGTVLAFVKKIDLPENDYQNIASTSDGSIWLSGSLNDIIRIKDGAVINTYEDIDNLAIHPSGAWGVDYFTTNECNIVTFSGDTYTKTPMTFKEAGTIMNLCVDENNIYVCANAADESGHKVFVYNKDGVLQKTLCDAEGGGLGSVTFMTQTSNGYIGFDGNMRDVLFWKNDGSFIAEISDGDLFGTNYPWFCSSTVLSDGSVLTVMTEEREDKSATELIVFNVKGF